MSIYTYPKAGRGAWSAVGGTLSLDGRNPGSYYRAPASGKYDDMPGATAHKALKAGTPVEINSFAVFMGVRAIQAQLGVKPDGLFGGDTGAAVKAFQAKYPARCGVADGIVGPRTSRALFERLLSAACAGRTTAALTLEFLVRGHVGHESSWDPGAVGWVTPQDLGLGQINGPSHPDMDEVERLTPGVSLPWVATFVDGNVVAMKGVLDDGIAAYLLGVSGARTWVKLGRPAVWVRSNADGDTISTDVADYIADVRRAAATV